MTCLPKRHTATISKLLEIYWVHLHSVFILWKKFFISELNKMIIRVDIRNTEELLESSNGSYLCSLESSWLLSTDDKPQKYIHRFH